MSCSLVSFCQSLPEMPTLAGQDCPASLLDKIQLSFAANYYNYAILTVLFYDAGKSLKNLVWTKAF